MWWLKFVGPVVVVLLFVLTGQPDKRRRGELQRFLRAFGPKLRDLDLTHRFRPLPDGEGAREVSAIPAPFRRLLDEVGGGTPAKHVELVPKLAFLSSVEADAMSASDHVTVTAKLEADAPTFALRPLPIVEGERVANTGVEFKKDPDFMALFLVEPAPGGPAAGTPQAAELAKKIRGFLTREIRDALRELPDAWLRVQGRALALTLFGPVDAAALRDLVKTADVIFEAHGADGGPSLFGDDEEDDAADDAKVAAPAKPAKA